MAKEGEIVSVRIRVVGEGLVDLLEEMRIYGDVTWREEGGDVGSRGEE